MDDKMKPTPGIENMDPKIARAHFKVRAKMLSREIDSLPPSEMLRAAADLIDQGGERMHGWAKQIAARVIQKLSG